MIVTLDSVKKYLKIDTGDNDAYLTSLINSASSYIKSYCNQPIEAEAGHVHYFSGDGQSYHVLPFTCDLPVVASLQTQSGPLEAWTTIDSSLYTVIQEYGSYALYYENGFDSGWANYKITLSTGYAIIPYDLQQTAKEMVAIMWRESKADQGLLGVTTQNNNIAGTTANTDYSRMTKEHKEVLNRYRIANIF